MKTINAQKITQIYLNESMNLETNFSDSKTKFQLLAKGVEKILMCTE